MSKIEVKLRILNFYWVVYIVVEKFEDIVLFLGLGIVYINLCGWDLLI